MKYIESKNEGLGAKIANESPRQIEVPARIYPEILVAVPSYWD